MSNTFDIKDVLLQGWEGLKNNALVFISLTFISFAVSILANILFSGLPFVISSVLVLFINSYFMLSIVKASFLALEGQKVSFNVLKNDMNLFFKFFLVWFILSIILMLATILFILPVFLALAVFFPVIYIAATKTELKIIDIFKKSWEITTKDFGTCLLFILVSALLVVLGVISIVGLFVVIPIVYIATAEAYKKLIAEEIKTVESPASSAEATSVIETKTVESSADTVKNDTVKED